jgi:hypothetical protein
MIGAVLLAVAVLVAWGIWAKTHDSASPGRRAAGPSEAEPEPAPGLQAGPTGLERWVTAGLITSEQAESIRAFERAEAVARPPARERRVSLIAEALGYVGTALALAGAAVGLSQAWEGFPSWSRLVTAFGTAALLVLGGLVLLRQTEPAFRRLQSVLWVLAVGAAAWAMGVLHVEVLELEAPEQVVLLIGAGSAALALVLWVVRRDPLQHAALFATLVVALIGAILSLPGEAPVWVYGLAVWLVGVLWGVLGWQRVLPPWWLAVALGSVAATVGPAVGIDEYPWLLVVALGTALFLMVVSVPTGQVPLLGVGTLGTFGYTTWAVFRYFGDSLGVPLTLVVVGGVFLGLAVVAGRLTQVTRQRRHPGAGEAAG